MKYLALFFLLPLLLSGCLYFARGPGGEPSPFDDAIGNSIGKFMSGNWVGGLVGFVTTSITATYAAKKRSDAKKEKRAKEEAEQAKEEAERREREHARPFPAGVHTRRIGQDAGSSDEQDDEKEENGRGLRRTQHHSGPPWR